ncbi:MAG: DNA polymerase III subunit gamma/tau [Thermomicrobiales bacterium]
MASAPARGSRNDSGGAAAAGGYQHTSSLYRKYRPNSFAADELVGQSHIVRTLQNAVRLNRVGHAYLFSGPRGTGKTTTARLLAKAVNCLAEDPAQRPCNVCANCIAINSGSSPDVIEIDAASNRGIDDIRDLRDKVRYAPTQLPSKVYIIDEAHQITGAAANAFLKTLEEPPAHSRFILATTDPEELLPTIVSRCQRFEFRRHSAEDMARRLRTVADHEGFQVSEDALLLIGRHATGSLRDALGLLEQLALQAGNGEQPIEVADVRAALGLSRNERVEAIVAALGARDAATALSVVQASVDEGEDPRQLNRQLTAFLRSLMLERAGASQSSDATAMDLAQRFSLHELAAQAQRFAEIDFNIKHSPFPQLPLEIAIVSATTSSDLAASPDRQINEHRPDTSLRSFEQAPPSVEAPSAPRVTSLRDRVRNPGAAREATSPPSREPAVTEPQPPRVEPAPITPLRSAPAPAQPVQPPVPVVGAAGGDVYDVAQVAELWPRIRSDVKAVNRRIEALLSEVDPVAISETEVTLAVPYPFHRDKLNSDEVRETVADVLSRNLGRKVTIACVLRGEYVAPMAAPQAAAQAATRVIAVESAPAVDPDAAPLDVDPGDDADEARLQAARNLLDAEEIEEAEFTRLYGDAAST